MERDEIPEIPAAVIREVLANSFAHAIYGGRTYHEICIHPGMITIYSPGDYASKYMPEEYIKEHHESELRNDTISKMLYLCKRIEQFGSGFKRIDSLCKDAKVKYSYENTRNGFKFILYRNRIHSDTQSDILDVTLDVSLNGIKTFDELVELTDNAVKRFDELSESIKVKQKRLEEIAETKKQIVNYARTRETYEAYKRSGYSRRFFEANREQLQLHQAAKEFFNTKNITKFPKMKELSDEYDRVLTEKKREYAEYKKVKERMQDYMIARQNLETLQGGRSEGDRRTETSVRFLL